MFCTHCLHNDTDWSVDTMECQCLRWKSNEVEQFLEAETFSAGLNMYQVDEETGNLWGIKMSFLLMLRQWQGRNTLFENSGSRFFGGNLKPSWKDDALIRLDSLLKPGVNPTLLLIGQPTWAADTSLYVFPICYFIIAYTPNTTQVSSS